MDAATGEPDRGDLPTLDRIVDYRTAVAERVHYRVSAGYVFVALLPAIFGSFAAGLLFALLGIALRGQWATGEVRR